MSKTIEEILVPKPEVRPRIYAYSIDDKAHEGLLKVGQTTRQVKQRVAQQLKTPAIKNYKIELDESAEREDGTMFTDYEVREALVKKHRAPHEKLYLPTSPVWCGPPDQGKRSKSKRQVTPTGSFNPR